MDRSVLARKPMTELKDIASHLNMRGYNKLRKAELIDAIMQSGPDGGGQQTLTADLETAAATDAPTPAEGEEGARKVLPPTAREQAGDAVEDAAATEDADDAAPSRSRNGRTRTRNGATRDTDGATAQTSTADSDATASSADGREQSEDDDEDAGSRKRRNRRDRRKRNRDRQDEGNGQDNGSQPSGQDQSGKDQSGKDQSSGQQQRGQGGSGNEPGEVRAGVLDILPEGYGFLRTTGYLPGERDVYVSQGQIRKHALRRGDVVQGPIRQQRSNEKVPALHHVQKVNGEDLEQGQVPARPSFEDLPVTDPDTRLDILGTADGEDATPSTAMRMVDLVAPLGQGQRALVLCPPRSAKDTLLRELADALADAAPDAHLMLVMIDERPEAVTEMTDAVDGEVIASTFDAAAEDHAQITELAIERAQRLVELGHDVVVLLDSLTRLARAHGVTVQGNGRTIAPGLEAASLYPSKRIMSAARCIEGGGSLTIVATVLTGTGSSLDEVILEEFRRTANAEIVLDPTLTRRGVWPSISVQDSGTLGESRLQDEDEVAVVRRLRRAVEAMTPADATELVLDKMVQTDSNPDFVAQILKSGL